MCKILNWTFQKGHNAHVSNEHEWSYPGLQRRSRAAFQSG
jgi:hypothetical protein